MGQRPVGALLLEFSLPSIAGMLVSALYNLVDRIFIGRGVGVDGIAAVTAAFPIMVIGLAIGLLFSSGARSLAALAMGRGDKPRAEELVSRSFGAAFLLASLASAACYLAADPLLSLFGATSSVLPEAKSYLGWVLLGAPLQAAQMTLASALQVQGRPRSSFAVMLMGTIVNAGLAPLFIFGLGWGLGGAGLAVAISEAVSLAATLALVLGKKSAIRLRPSLAIPALGPVAEVAKSGMPLFLVQILGCVTMVVANNAVKPYGGELGLAVIGVVNTVANVLGFPVFGITNGAQALWGYNYGAGLWKRVRRVTLLAFSWCFALAALSELAMVATPGFFIGLFSGDPAFVELGSKSLAIFLAAFILYPLEIVPMSYYQSTGRPLPAIALMLCRNLAMIAGMIVLPRFWGLTGVLLAGPLSDIVTAALGLAYTLRMKSELGRESLKESLRSIPERASELEGISSFVHGVEGQAV
jgi:putative MATE family efflux protein